MNKLDFFLDFRCIHLSSYGRKGCPFFMMGGWSEDLFSGRRGVANFFSGILGGHDFFSEIWATTKIFLFFL